MAASTIFQSISSLMNRKGFRYFLFFMLLLDVVGIMFYMGKNPFFSQYVWLIVSGLVTGLVTLARALGWSIKEKEKPEFKGVDGFLGDRYIQIAVIAFSVFLLLLLIWPDLLSPAASTITVHALGTRDDSTSRVSIGDVVLYSQRQAAPSKDTETIRFGKDVVFTPVDEGAPFRLYLQPFDNDLFEPDSFNSGYVPEKDTVVDLNLQRRIHVLPFVISPFGATMSVDGAVCDTTLHPTGAGELRLQKGKYSYKLIADSDRDYDSITGFFYVPSDTLRLSLNRKSIGVRFVANRGIKPDLVPVPASFTISQGSSVVKAGLASWEQISLGSGLDYTVGARGSDDWDLSHRVYVGSQKFKVFRTGSKADTIIYVSVKEQVPRPHSSDERR